MEVAPGMNAMPLPRLNWLLLGTLVAGLLTSGSASAAERTPAIPESKADSVINFSLLDYRGGYHELRRSDARVVVLYFASFSCNKLRPALGKIRGFQRQWSDKGVEVWLVNASTKEDPSDAMLMMLASGRKNGPIPDTTKIDPETLRLEVIRSAVGTMPVLRDERQLVAQQFDVNTSGEVVAVDPKSMQVIYRGALDDQPLEKSGRGEAKTKYLANAIEEFLAGKPVTLAKTEPDGCAIRFEVEPAATPISYRETVAPLLEKHCVSCHSPGQIGPFSMSSYAKVKGWSAMIEEVLLDRRMPPWHADPHYGKFANDRSLTQREARQIIDWVRQGCPRGEGADPLAVERKPAPVWDLGQPDYVAALPQREEIPATGTVRYRYIDSAFVMPEDAWLRAAVVRADNPKVVHHIIVRVHYPDGFKDAPKDSYLFTTWVPGLAAAEFPAGTGMFVPKGARFNFEVHYTTNGKPETDQSELGLYVAKEKPSKLLEVRVSETRDFEIPPGSKNAEHNSHYCFTRDTLLYELSPHMHLRGSTFRYTALYPDGRRETLLSVPNYDFNWQTSYRLKEPKRIPAGTWIFCTGSHDNSAKNPNNPDPTKTIRWGLQSWEEMFMGFMTVAEVGGDITAEAQKR